MRRSWLLAAAALLVLVVLIGLNSGPVTSSQAIRAARMTPSTIEAPSEPFCRVVRSRPTLSDDPGYVGSDEQLTALAELEAVATPTVRRHLGVLRQQIASGDLVGSDPDRWPAPVRNTIASIDDFVSANC